jgi:hypothetical protein
MVRPFCLDAGMAQSRARTTTSLILFVVGTLLLPVGLIGHWAHRTFTDTQRYVETVAPLTQNPEVQAGIAQTLTDSLITVDGAAAQVEQWFPRAPEGLATTLAEAVVTRVESAIEKLVASEQFSDLWAKANTEAQQAAIALLSNDPPPSLSVQDGDVVLDLGVVTQSVREQLAADGINLPQTNVQPPTVVLMQDSQIQQIRGYYSWGAPLLQWFILLPILLLALSVFLHPAKPRALRRMGVGVLVAAGIVAVFLFGGKAAISPSLSDTAFAPAESAIWQTLTAYLSRGAWITAGVGVLLVLVGWVWMRRTPAV